MVVLESLVDFFMISYNAQTISKLSLLFLKVLIESLRIFSIKAYGSFIWYSIRSCWKPNSAKPDFRLQITPYGRLVAGYSKKPLIRNHIS